MQTFPVRDGKQQISNDGGTQPIWAPDGHRLICRRTDQLWVLDLQTDAGFPAGKPRLLLERPVFATTAVVRNWDLSLTAGDSRQ